MAASSVVAFQSPGGFVQSPDWQSKILLFYLGTNNYNNELLLTVKERSSTSRRISNSSSNCGGFANMAAQGAPSLSASSSSSSSTWSSSSDPTSPFSEPSTSSTRSNTSSSECEPAVVDDVVHLPEKFDEDGLTHAGEIRKVFQKLDQNNDGLICCKDLMSFTERLGFDMSMEDAISLVESVDHNKDGRLDFGEFYSVYESLNDKATRDDETDDEDDTLRQAFQVFDKDDDGYITVRELQTVLRDLGLPEGKSLKCCQRMIQRVSSKRKDRIDLGEFKAMMCSSTFKAE